MEDGSLDRGALARIVFSDEAARRDLEAITHPLIARRAAGDPLRRPLRRARRYDVPLLVEPDGADLRRRLSRRGPARGASRPPRRTGHR